MIERAITLLIDNAPTLAPLIGQRRYPLIFPQAYTAPAMTYQVISGPRDYTQDGADGVTTFRVQVRIRGNTHREAVTVRDALEADLSGLHHAILGSPPVYVHGVFLDNEAAEYDGETVIPGPERSGMRLDLFVTVSNEKWS